MQKMLQDKLFKGLSNELFFNQPYLDSDDPKCNANEFFKEISYNINLQDIYKFKGTCYYHDEMLYCPILLEIGPEKVRQGYDNSTHLLQVWNMKKDKIYEKGLKASVRVWTICYRYLVYTLEEGSEESEFVHIVDLENQNQEIKVKNFATNPLVKYLSYNKELLFCATKSEIELCKISTDNFSSETVTIDANDIKVRKIEPGMVVHGLLLNQFCLDDGFQLVALETKDNQIDFNRLFIDNFDDEDSYAFRWTQYRELVPRCQQHKSDPILKSCFTFVGGFNYSCTLRQSGSFDLYWNMMRQESTEDKKVSDIEMTSDAFYFKMADNNQYGFKHKNTSTVSFQQAIPFSTDDLEWDLIQMKRVQTLVNIYTGFKIFSIYSGANQQSFCVISHGKFISIFNITLWEWVNHLEFQDDVIFMFTHKNAEGSLYTSCMTKKGWIYIGFMYDGGNWKDVVQESWRGAHAEGVVKDFSEDAEANKTLFVIHKREGNTHLSMMYQSELQRQDQYLTATDRVSVNMVSIRGDKH